MAQPPAYPLPVVVRVDSEVEAEIAHALLDAPEDRPGAVAGLLAEDRVAALKATGLTVDADPSAPDPLAARGGEAPEAVIQSLRGEPAASRFTDEDVHAYLAELEEEVPPLARGGRPGLVADVDGPPLDAPFAKSRSFAEDVPPRDTFMVRFERAPEAESLDRLRAQGVEVQKMTGDRSAVVRARSPGDVHDAGAAVEHVERHSLERTVAPDLAQELLARRIDPSLAAATDEHVVLDVALHTEDDLAGVTAAVEGLDGAEVLEASGRFLRVRTTLDEGRVASLAAMPEVETVATYEPPELFASVAGPLIGLPLNRSAWKGAGQTVVVVDSGLDEHRDLAAPRVVRTSDRSGSREDRVGHGTHVAGIVAGSGDASAGDVQGVAPQASLVSVGIVDAAREIDFPPDLRPFLERHVVDQGAHIVNLSLGFRSPKGAYTHYAYQLDQFVHDHPEVLVVVATGNYGVAPEGFPRLDTLSPLATAKNGISVGACGTGDPGLADTWAERYASTDFGEPIGSTRLAGTPDEVAASSSRGPAIAAAVKPDVVAPGWVLRSTRAKAPAPNLYLAEDPHYALLGGTSMAAPVVAGAAAVLREFLVAEHGLAAPSAACLKACLIAGAVPLPARTAPAGVADAIGYPDFDAGFGRVDLARLVGDEAEGLVVLDVPRTHDDALPKPGAFAGHLHRFRFRVDAEDRPVSVVLAYTDHPGSGLQNNVNLEVVGPVPEKMIGNGTHRFGSHATLNALFGDNAQAPDRTNNVEIVRAALPPGTYTAKVRAVAVPFPKQGFALAVHGPVSAAP